MIRRYFYTILFLIFSISGIASESFALSLSDIRMTMDKMFSYHVENKEFSPIKKIKQEINENSLNERLSSLLHAFCY